MLANLITCKLKKIAQKNLKQISNMKIIKYKDITSIYDYQNSLEAFFIYFSTRPNTFKVINARMVIGNIRISSANWVGKIPIANNTGNSAQWKYTIDVYGSFDFKNFMDYVIRYEKLNSKK